MEGSRAAEGHPVRVRQRAWRYLAQELTARAEPLNTVGSALDT